MLRPTCLPTGAVELRATDSGRRKPFLGGVDASARVGFFSHKAGDCHWLPIREVIAAAAKAANCSYEQMLDFLRNQDPNFTAAPSGSDLREIAHGDHSSEPGLS